MAATDLAAQPLVKNEDTLAGFLYALTAYLLWGVLPIYMKMISHIPALEVVAHRALWSLPIATIVILLRGRIGDVLALLKQPRRVGMAAAMALFVTINWLVYVYSISTGRALEAALGYYVNPLISIVIAAIFLGERLRGPQMVAVGLAAVAVAILAYGAGGLPWISLVLAISWGFYAFFKKSMPLGPNEGFFLEVLILSVPAVGYLIYLAATGQNHFLQASAPNNVWLLMFSGVATATPLMIYANGAKLLRLSTTAIMQYITPTMVFFIAVFVFGEPFGVTKLVAFGCIWAALIVYTASMVWGSKTR